MGFVSTISNQPTTLKRKCKNGNYLNYPIDNIYYPKKHFKKLKGYSLDFVNNCENLKFVRKISDHLPVVAELIFID